MLEFLNKLVNRLLYDPYDYWESVFKHRAERRHKKLQEKVKIVHEDLWELIQRLYPESKKTCYKQI